MSHQQLVESVCEKAQNLVDQTQDKSLNVYLQSIKQLFQNIVSKSQDLLDRYETSCNYLIIWKRKIETIEKRWCPFIMFFKNINLPSNWSISVDSLGENVEKHNKFSSCCDSLRDWLAGEKEKLEECDDGTGEKAEVKHRLETLKVSILYLIK